MPIGLGCPGSWGGRLLIGSLAGLVLLVGAASASATNLLYFGGPVVHTANVVLVKWGPDVRASYTDPTRGDPGFLKYLSAQSGSTSDIGGVLAQYMDTTGHNSQNRFKLLGTVQINPSVAPTPPGNVLDSQIQSVLQSQIQGGALPAPAGNGLSTIYVVLFPPGDNVCFNGGGCAYASGGFCAYHGSSQVAGSSTQVLYAAMVDDGPGTPNYGGCGGASNDVASQTAVVSHEVAETINDPLDSVTTWYDFKFNGEIADKCDGVPVVTDGPWTVEPLWSNRDQNCLGGESAFRAPTASFLASSTGAVGQKLGFNAGSSSDPSGNGTSALDQNSKKTYSLSPGIVSYRWNWGDGTPAATTTGASTNHTFAAPGNYQVSLTVTDRLGFASTKTQLVSIGGGTPGTPFASTGSATGIGAQQATLNGTINPEGQTVSYRFIYGTSQSNLNQSTSSASGPSGQSTVPVSATIQGLPSGTTYYYELVVTDAGQSYPGGVQSFTTSSSSPGTPMVATGPAGQVSSSGAILTGTINPEGQAVFYHFVYGTSSGNLRSTPSVSGPTGQTASSVSATISGLSPGTTYRYALVATTQGHTYSGALKSFTTLSHLPGAVTGPASNITSDSALISGAINPNGSNTIYQVQFGANKTYGHSSVWITGGSGRSYKPVSIVLFGLHPRTTYHYRLLAQTAHGTTVGADRTFTTAGAPGYAPRFRFTVPARISLQHLLTHPVRVHFSCNRGCVAHFRLAVERSGMVRMGALPMTVGRGRARIRKAGSGTARLTFTARFHKRMSQLGGKRLTLVVLGFATARHRGISPPREARIRLTR